MVSGPTQRTNPVHRARLIERLKLALDRRGAALIAGPGYGKTTLLTNFVAECGLPSVWCDLAEHRGDALACVRQILADVERTVPRLQLRQLNRLRHSRATVHDALAAIDSLIAAHEALATEPFLLVVDEFHLVRSDSNLERCFDRLLCRLPRSWRILIASREEPSSPQLARLMQYGEIEALYEDDLAFTLDETVELLAADLPISVARARAPQVSAATGGWPAGISLIERSLPTDASRSGPAIVDPTTYRYFARTVLAEVEPTLRAFLVRSSVLPYVESSLCDAVLSRADSAQQIARLAHDHLFLVRRQAEPGTYRYHALFREFLLGELRAECSVQEVRDLHRRAAHHLLENGQVEEAANQFLEVAAWAEFADLLRVQAESMTHSGQAATVLRWIDRIPGATISESPWLLHYRGRCLRLLGLPGDLRSLQRRAQMLFARQGEGVGRARALLEEVKAAELARNYAEAAALCLEVLSIVGDETGIRSDVLANLVFYYTMQGRLDEARDAGAQALDLLPLLEHAGTRAVHHALVKRHLGVAYAFGGDFRSGLATLHEACDLAGSVEAEERHRVQALGSRALVEAMRGDFDDAFVDLEEAGRLAEAYGLSAYGRRVRGIRGEILANIGKYAAAEEQFRLARWLCDEWADAGYFYYRAGQYHKAIDLYESEIARVGAASDPVNRSRAQALLGASLVALGSVAAGGQLLQQALATYRSLGFRSRTPGIGLHLADIAFTEGREDSGREFLAEALTTAHAGGAYHFFAFQPAILFRSLSRARSMNILPQFVSALEKRWPDLLAQVGVEPTMTDRSDQSWLAFRGVLEPCPDDGVRRDLAHALARGHLTTTGLQSLKSDFGLTWRELQVFVRYYVPDREPLPDSDGSNRRRLDLAKDLGISEYTVRHHINVIRSKIGIASQQRGFSVYHWAVARNIAR